MATRAEEWTEFEPEAQESSPRLGQIAAALAKAQNEMHNPGFDATNPHFRNKFASLAAVRNAVVPVLAKFGIAVSQDLASAEGSVSCVTILTHGSGQQMRFGPLVLPVSKNDAQGFGSAATYARRYSLMAVACVVGDDDDDANAATGKPARSQAYAAPHTPAGDMGKDVAIDLAKQTADAMMKIIDAEPKDGDHDGRLKALAALDYHEKVLNKDQELYVAAGKQMPTAKRNVWHTLISVARKAEKDDRASAPTNGRRF